MRKIIRKKIWHIRKCELNLQRIKKLTAAKFTKKRRQNRNLINGNMTMTTITTLSDNEMREDLSRPHRFTDNL